MTDYFIDDAANGTNNGLSWETCYNTWAQARDSGILASSANRLIVGADAAISHGAAALTLVGPTTAAPVTIISSAVGSGTAVSYSASSTNQMETTGTNSITLDGSFALYGLKIVSGRDILLTPAAAESFFGNSCVFSIGTGRNIQGGASGAPGLLVNCQIVLNDSGNTSAEVSELWTFSAIGLTFANASTRTGNIFRNSSTAGRRVFFSGCDFSGFSNATKCEIVGANTASSDFVFSNCKTHTAPVFTSVTSYRQSGRNAFYNCGPADAPEQLFIETAEGKVESDTGVYRTGGAQVETVPVSWKITASATCSEHLPLYTDWIYGTTTAGTKTFSVAIAHENEGNGTAGALLNSECWLEVEVMGTADDALSTLYADRPATITTAATDQTTDGVSSWTGSPGGDLQTLSCADVTVGEAGLYRARVAVGLASAGPIYIDPKVTVT